MLIIWSCLVIIALMIAGPLAVRLCRPDLMQRDWQTASHESSHQAPDPAKHSQAVLQVYAARAYNWRGLFAVHTWIAAKAANAPNYVRYEVIGWNLLKGGTSAVAVGQHYEPDGLWYGEKPVIIKDLRGPLAQQAITRLDAAVESYPYAGVYKAWPGPNSNSFTAHVARQIPELNLEMPANALGKDFIASDMFGNKNGFLARTPSHTGFQFSVRGLFGIALGLHEGLEINILGLVFGIDPFDFAIKLPAIGRLPPLKVKDRR